MNKRSQKITRGINSVTTTRAEMARAIKISPPRVTQLVQEGIIPVDESGSVLLVDGIKETLINSALLYFHAS